MVVDQVAFFRPKFVPIRYSNEDIYSCIQYMYSCRLYLEHSKVKVVETRQLNNMLWVPISLEYKAIDQVKI